MKSIRRLSLPHNSYQKPLAPLPNNPTPNIPLAPLSNTPPPNIPLAPLLDALPPTPPLQQKFAQFKLCPLIEIVEEEIEQHAKEFEMHKIHEATSKMHISNLLV